jgi:hypothetical protein
LTRRKVIIQVFGARGARRGSDAGAVPKTDGTRLGSNNLIQLEVDFTFTRMPEYGGAIPARHTCEGEDI